MTDPVPKDSEARDQQDLPVSLGSVWPYSLMYHILDPKANEIVRPWE